ncbi:OB-fold domain-containing protein [Acuticoccus sp. M5D2P5]|uniref:Zn-ribbon domain-containing OB-fold protein n=1 Tax=Acuticoccus kalidii TaxID=2910977 RepID=UPI001F25062C|nr:OB-fold domain-containing protein [Acuticoccus kalidii]MCF3933727.1 OB-fold domain-containing protein [Acuticoccus kalidii]
MAMTSETSQTIPNRVLGLYDKPFWQLLAETRALHLQRCGSCGAFRYPPGPVCHECLSPDYAWTAVSGGGSIMSWVIFHRQYLDLYPAPYNVVAVRLDEGPIIISNLTGAEPEGSWIDRRVEMVPVPIGAEILPRFALVR